jgi:hypothetical protein
MTANCTGKGVFVVKKFGLELQEKAVQLRATVEGAREAVGEMMAKPSDVDLADLGFTLTADHLALLGEITYPQPGAHIKARWQEVLGMTPLLSCVSVKPLRSVFQEVADYAADEAFVGQGWHMHAVYRDGSEFCLALMEVRTSVGGGSPVGIFDLECDVGDGEEQVRQLLFASEEGLKWAWADFGCEMIRPAGSPGKGTGRESTE